DRFARSRNAAVYPPGHGICSFRRQRTFPRGPAAARAGASRDFGSMTEKPAMSMRLQEIHPALVHYPIALLPTSIVADTIGRVIGSQSLMDLGRRTMPLAVVSAAAAGVFG